MIMKFILKQENFFKEFNLFSGFQFLCIYMICCGYNLKEKIQEGTHKNLKS